MRGHYGKTRSSLMFDKSISSAYITQMCALSIYYNLKISALTTIVVYYSISMV